MNLSKIGTNIIRGWLPNVLTSIMPVKHGFPSQLAVAKCVMKQHFHLIFMARQLIRILCCCGGMWASQAAAAAPGHPAQQAAAQDYKRSPISSVETEEECL